MTEADGSRRLLLFPLHSVLFPGATVRLRVFERRYLDLIRECTRHGSEFGVCLILEGSEAGAPATPAAVGTSAVITDFHTLPDGLLGVVATGGRRFHVDHAGVRDDGLVVADIHWLPKDEIDQPVPAQYGLLASLLHRLLEEFGELPERIALLDDAAWVAYRLAQILPLAAADRQRLLALDDATARLEQLALWLPELPTAS